MEPEEMHKRWQETEKYLLQAKAAMPEEALNDIDLVQFDLMIKHNELLLAWDLLYHCLQKRVDKPNCGVDRFMASWESMFNLMLAARNMLGDYK